ASSATRRCSSGDRLHKSSSWRIAVQFRIEPPPCPDSPLARLDPRWKLAAVVLVMIGVVLLRTLLGVGLALLGALVLLALTRVPWRWLRWRLGAVAILLLLFALPAPLLARGEPLESLQWIAEMAGKALTLFLLGTVVLVSSPLEATMKAARSLLVP